MPPSRTPATARAPRRRARRPPTAAAPADHRGSTRSTTPLASCRTAPTAPPRTSRRHSDVGEGQWYGRRRFVYDYLDGVYAFVPHHIVGYRARDCLDELARRPGDDVGGPLSELAVVERVGKVVAGRCGRQVDPHGDVDDEVLAVASFVIEHTVISANSQAAQFDS